VGLVTFGQGLGVALLRERQGLVEVAQGITLLEELMALLTLAVAVEREVPQVALA
jgi:hypothetical protein